MGDKTTINAFHVLSSSGTVGTCAPWYDSFSYWQKMFHPINDADMKKLFLTGVTAALFSFAALGQQRDSVQNESNQFRQSDQQQQNPAATDTSSIYNNQEQQQPDQDIQQQPGNEFNQDANGVQDSVNQNDMERPSNQYQENPSNQYQENSQQSQDMQQTPETDDNLNRQPDNQQTDSTLNGMNDQFRSSVEDNQGMAQAPDIEVVKDKEGPDNQVVYEYKGDFYYVDRQKKELVKADKSDLQNAEHEVIIDQGGETQGNNSNNSDSNNNR